MPGPICRHCGGWLVSFPDGHDEDACREDRQRETNARGVELAREAHRAAVAEHPEPEPDTP